MDARLESWCDIQNELPRRNLLLGNGSSRAIWNRFGYSSICEQAKETEHPLTREDVNLFDALDTRNFEAVLSALQTAQLVCRSIGVETAVIRDRYESIRVALMQAIRKTHVEHRLVFEVLPKLRRELRRYSYVFTTNYDLLVYWAVMAEDGPEPFRDYFWNRCGNAGSWTCFDADDSAVNDANAAKILYIHGALHLVEFSSGETAKLVSREANLLEQFTVA